MNKLIVVVDLGCFKSYRVVKDELNGAEKLEPLEQYDNTVAHQRFAETVTDQAGRFPGGGLNGGMGQGENHNSETEMRRRLLRQLSDRLNELIRRTACDHWYFGAPREIHQRLVESLHPDVRERLRKKLPADLTKIPVSEVLARFKAA